jgi:chromosome segregation ATPase
MAPLLVLLLSFSVAYGDLSSLSGSLDIVVKGRLCIEVVENTVQALISGEGEKATTHLQSLQAESQYLEEHAESRIELLKGVRDGFQSEIRKQIAECSLKKTTLESEKKNTEASLYKKQKDLEYGRNEISQARDELGRATDQAKHHAGRYGWIGAGLGTITGSCPAGLGGAAVGFVVGGIGGKLVDYLGGLDLERAVEKAQHRVRDTEQTFMISEKAVRDTEQLISKQEKEIADLTVEIESKKSQFDRETEQIREAIDFHTQAANLWGMVSTSAEDCSVNSLKTIIAEATEKKSWKILRSDGTLLAEASFLEAWEEVETTAKKTGSFYQMFLVE